jgi:hypothetical protein
MQPYHPVCAIRSTPTRVRINPSPRALKRTTKASPICNSPLSKQYRLVKETATAKQQSPVSVQYNSAVKESPQFKLKNSPTNRRRRMLFVAGT